MQAMTASDWQALIQATPNTAENQSLLALLDNYASLASVWRVPWWYNLIYLALPLAVPAVQSFQVDASAPFVITHTMVHADVGGVAQTISGLNIPNATITLVITGSNQQLMDVATPIGSIFGTGQYPYYWAEARQLAANSQLTGTVTSQEAANTPNIRLTFGGYRLYSSSPS